MAQAALVESQLESGRELRKKLIEEGINVSAACWAHVVEEDAWFLYLVSTNVETQGVTTAYRSISKILHDVRTLDLSISEIRVVGLSHRINKDLIEPMRLKGAIGPRFRPSDLGEFDEVYIYPPLPRPSPPPPVRTKVFTLSTIPKGATKEEIVDEIGSIDAVIGEDEFNSRLVELLQARYGSLEQFQAASPRILLEAVN